MYEIRTDNYKFFKKAQKRVKFFSFNESLSRQTAVKCGLRAGRRLRQSIRNFSCKSVSKS